jgi:hypothetical protein
MRALIALQTARQTRGTLSRDAIHVKRLLLVADRRDRLVASLYCSV